MRTLSLVFIIRCHDIFLPRSIDQRLIWLIWKFCRSVRVGGLHHFYRCVHYFLHAMVFLHTTQYGDKRCKHSAQMTTQSQPKWKRQGVSECVCVCKGNMAIERNWMNYLPNYQYYWWSLMRLCHTFVFDSVLFFNCVSCGVLVLNVPNVEGIHQPHWDTHTNPWFLSSFACHEINLINSRFTT